MAGKGPELLVSPTDDMGKILSSLHGVAIHGKANFSAAIHIAQVLYYFVEPTVYNGAFEGFPKATPRVSGSFICHVISR